MVSSKAVLTSVIDKNGKHTSVWKNPNPAMITRLPPGAPSFPVNEDNHEKIFYEEIRKKCEMLFHEGTPWSIAPEGKSGAYCFQCQYHFDKELINSGAQAWECPGCGSGTLEGLTGVSILPEALEFLDDEAVLNTTWFHTTIREDWDERLKGHQGEDTPLTHLGTLEAATVRMEDLKRERESEGLAPAQFYLYEVALLPTMSISESLADDDNDSAPESVKDWRRDRFEKYDLFGCTRYVNMYESVGSISLLANPHHFEVVNKTAL